MNRLIQIIIIIVVVLFIEHLFNEKNKELFAGTGSLVQLYSKGPQDEYLMTDVEKYYLPYFMYFPRMIWNMPTRMRYYSINGIFPYSHLFPFQYIFS